MDSQQILRYTIPGSLFGLAATAFFVLIESIAGAPPAAAIDPLRSIDPVIAVAAVVPIGFFAYQFYYRGQGPVLRIAGAMKLVRDRLGGVPVTADGGGLVLSHLPRRELERTLIAFKASYPVEAVTDPGRYFGLREVDLWQALRASVSEDTVEQAGEPVHREEAPAPRKPLRTIQVVSDLKRQAEYVETWHHTKQIERALRDLAELAHSPGVKGQYSRVTQISNTLGASRAAIAAAAIAAAIVAAMDLRSGRLDALEVVEVAWLGYWAGVAVVGSLAAAVWGVFYAARQRSSHAALVGLGWGLRSFVLAHPESLENLVRAAEAENSGA